MFLNTGWDPLDRRYQVSQTLNHCETALHVDPISIFHSWSLDILNQPNLKIPGAPQIRRRASWFVQQKGMAEEWPKHLFQKEFELIFLQ